jgi:glutamine synthetase
VLQVALERLRARGLALRCGLEVEFHIHRIVDDGLDPVAADWPGEPPVVRLIHPGYNLLADGWSDLADAPLAIVRRTALALGLPLRSLEIELGPSQVEAVFEACDALTAADRMVMFRNGVKQALRRAGYHASFVCRPPFPNVMASGWHLHQSLVDVQTGRNAMCRDLPAAEVGPGDARQVLSDLGAHYLGGLLHNALPTLAFCTTTVNGYGRFRPGAMAPMAALWGRDNRGAMLRVLGECGDADTRIENRVGEPMANPYLYIAAQVAAGLDGIERQLDPGPATDSPYAGDQRLLPTRLEAALEALEGDARMVAAIGPEIVHLWLGIKRSEARRHAAAEDSEAWQRREYFSRF